MDNQQLKIQLHESIENINDHVVLQTLHEIAGHNYSLLKEPELTSNQIKRIAESKMQIENKKSFTDEQANELIDSWLKK